MKNTLTILVASTLVVLFGFGCSKNSGGSGTSYSISSAAKTTIAKKSLGLFGEVGQVGQMIPGDTAPLSATGPTLCSSTICFTPTVLTGKYFGTGFLIQSQGNGMTATFGQEAWSGITGASAAFDFNSAAPVVNTGTLTCCNGTGDLSQPDSSYIESVIYLFGYIDATFAISGVTGNTSMNATYTVRFILADGVIATAKRGDVMLQDSGVFKWMDGSGTLSATRPSAPVTMNSSVVTYVNPFGADKGNQVIPVIYAPVTNAAAEPFTVTEADLKLVNRTYTIIFDPTNFIMFPTVPTTEINLISSVKEMLSRIHLGGLPHSAQPLGVGSPATTVLTVTN